MKWWSVSSCGGDEKIEKCLWNGSLLPGSFAFPIVHSHTIWLQCTPLLLMKKIIVLGAFMCLVIRSAVKGEREIFDSIKSREKYLKSARNFSLPFILRQDTCSRHISSQRAYFPLPISLIEDKIPVIWLDPKHWDFPDDNAFLSLCCSQVAFVLVSSSSLAYD